VAAAPILLIVPPARAQYGVDTVWVRRYDDPAHGSDVANAMTVDHAGNVYVTGIGDSDFVTIKYDRTGLQQWLARYDGPSHRQDGAYGIAVDDSGNVYVTGASEETPVFNFDFLTVKYNAAGVQQWAARYDGPVHMYDFAPAIAVDLSGNVYVTGTSTGTDTNGDYVTIKYNKSGVEQWVARYNGSGNDWDEPCAIAVDDSANVYVTGTSPNSSNYDFATVKYRGSDGHREWVARYNGPAHDDDEPSGLALDRAGHIYVTGYSLGDSGDADCVTVSYDLAGHERWVARYDNLRREDEGSAITVDDAGFVYVTGCTQAAQAVLYDYLTIAYDHNRNQQWLATYDGPLHQSDVAGAIAVDQLGNVYVTGTTTCSQYDFNYLTLKYNGDGHQQWAATYTSPGAFRDCPSAIAVDDSGNVCVTGCIYQLDTKDDWVTIKYTERVGVGERATPDASRITLDARPSPFAAWTTLRYSVSTASDVSLLIHDAAGNLVRKLVAGRQAPGSYSVVWDGRDAAGQTLSPGVYFCTLMADGQTEQRKIVVSR
jgi:hypothetical protein